MYTNTQADSSISDLQQLNQTVANLAQALAQSERRHAHLASMVRWGALAMVSLLVFAGFLMTGRIGIAQAQNPSAFPQATSTVEALNNINANLMVMGEMGKTLESLKPAIKDAVMSNPDVQAYVKNYFKKNKLNPTPAQQDAYAMQAVVQSVVRTFVDTVVLMQRVRDDSNAFRDYVTGPADVLRGVERQLQVMNVAMASIPTMAVQMDLMNHNMASMSYSMGSTMGRVGKWMPW